MKSQCPTIICIIATLAMFLPTHGWAVSCGDTIVNDTTLTADLFCPGLISNQDKALIIGANNITLDLNGHTISGPGGNIHNFGVFLQGKSGIAIKNGTIRDIGVGILVQSNADSNSIENVTFEFTNSLGVMIAHGSDGNTVENSRFLNGARAGLTIFNNSTSTIVRNNEFTANADTSSGGVLIIGGFVTDTNDATLVEGNLFEDNREIALFIGECNYSTIVDGNTFFDDPGIPNPGDGADQIHCEDRGIGTIFLDNVASPLQSCPPPDGFIPGHACASRDFDLDSVLDENDQCPNTLPGDVVDSSGCSISQLCPCAGPAEGGSWANHGDYVNCVAHTSEGFVAISLISEAEKDAIVSVAGQSDCGH